MINGQMEQWFVFSIFFLKKLDLNKMDLMIPSFLALMAVEVVK